MGDEPEPRIVRFPTQEEIEAAFGGYAKALGRANYAWNFLMERLGVLFVVVLDADRGRALAVWYEVESDRTKALMLKAAAEASRADRWPTLPTAREDIAWLADRAVRLADPRNNAVHAPATLVSDPDGHVMVASPFSGHRRAKNLAGTDLIAEFKWVEVWANKLSMFAQQIESALHPSGSYPWPDRPEKPEKPQRSDRLTPLRPAGSK